MKSLFLFLVAMGAFAANAASITFQPTSQTINLGASTTVDVRVGGLSANQALGAFDLLVLNNSSVLSATSVTFFSSLGDPTTELIGSTLKSGSVEAAETSFESTATLLGLQLSQPFSLFRLTYKAVGVGTSSLTLGTNPFILADGNGAILPTPTVTAGSITVKGGGNPSPVPEPSTFALLSSGGVLIVSAVRRRIAKTA